jgi:predicted alpha/beta superfamily hydrolase
MTLLLTHPCGTLIRHPLVQPGNLLPRHVDVWCPPGYAEATSTRYPVIYMHDGQMLFDPAHAFNGQVWAIDQAIIKLMSDSGHPGAIIVGIWNSPARWAEYMPARPLCAPEAAAVRNAFVQKVGSEPRSDHYLHFLVNELKPLIDASYRTLPDQANTFVMGSSMGGLISLYAVTEHPGTFGGAACLSTHWPIGGNILVDAFGTLVPPPERHRLYFDYGTEGLDAGYEPFQLRMNHHMRAAGYAEGRDYIVQGFVGADHNEDAWRARVHIPLRFLLVPQA